MKLKTLRTLRIGRATYARGSEVVLSEPIARDIVDRGYAEEMEASEPKEESKPEGLEEESKPEEPEEKAAPKGKGGKKKAD